MRIILLLLMIITFNISSLASEDTDNPNKNNFFIGNKGQWPEEVKFLAKIGGMNAWVTNEGIVYDFYKIEYDESLDYDSLRYAEPIEWMEKRNENARRKGHVIKMTFENTCRGTLPCAPTSFVGIKKSSTYYNYFIGNDSTKWASFVPLFEEVLIKNVYDGIDYRLYFDNGLLRYDLNVQPFSDLEQIQMKYEGQEGLEINENGELVINTSIGEVRNQNLIAYQENQQTECSFKIIDNNIVGFAASKYSMNIALTIDPLVYSTFIGGSGREQCNGIAIDGSGAVYVAGSTSSSDYPTTSGAYDETRNGDDVFVSKLNDGDTSLVYSTFLGGSSVDYGNGIAIDGSGAAYVTGETSSTDYPTTSGAYDETHNGNEDGFVTKLSADGSSLIYSTFMGGSGSVRDYGWDIAIDDTGAAYVTGKTRSSDYPVTSGAYDETHNGNDDGFVTKLSADGSSLIYSTYMGGSWDDDGFNIAIDGSGAAYVTGRTASSDFPTTSGAYDESHNGNYDVFVSKLNPGGSSLVYSTFIGGSSYDWVLCIAIDGSGSAYVTGWTESSGYPTTSGAYDESYNGNKDVFVSKLNPGGSSLVYSTFIGGSSSERACGITIYGTGTAYVTGGTASSNYPTTSGAFDESYNGNNDVFVSKLDADGSSLVYSTFIGGSGGGSVAYGIAIDSSGTAYVTGFTESSNYPTTSGAYDETYNGGGTDVFVTKLILEPGSHIIFCQISDSFLCIDETIDIPFTIAGTFNSGNKFIAQLSDSNGDFSNPVLLDSLSGTSSDTLKNVKFPITLSAGTGYRIRIVSTDPVYIGSDNGVDITINLLPTPTIIGESEVCPTKTESYYCIYNPNIDYQWSVAGGNIQGSNNDTLCHVVWGENESGTITLIETVTNTGCSDSAKLQVQIDSIPPVAILFADTASVCVNTITECVFSRVEGLGYYFGTHGTCHQAVKRIEREYDVKYFIIWHKAGIGTIKYCQFYDPSDCWNCVEHSVTVLPLPEVSFEGDSIVKAFSHTSYTAPDSDEYYFSWEVSGGTIDGDSTENIVGVNWGGSGIGIVKLMNIVYETNCVASLELAVTINSLPGEIAGTQSVCAQSEEIYSIEYEINYDYLWVVDGGEIQGIETDTSVTILWGDPESGIIQLIRTNTENMMKDTVVLHIEILELPEVIIAGTDELCEYDEVYYYAVNKENMTFKWSVYNAEIIGSDSKDSIIVQWNDIEFDEDSLFAKGTVTLEQTSGVNGCSNTKVKTVFISHKPSAEFLGNASVCQEDVETYMSVDKVVIQNSWEVIGGTVIGSASDSILQVEWGVPGKGSIKLIQIGVSNCTDSIMKEVSINAIPSKPVISQTGRRLKSSSLEGNQWFKGGNEIPGANNRNYTPDTSGYYTVQVTDTNGCKSDLSEPYYFDITPVDESNVKKQTLRIYPNPSTNQLFIEYYVDTSGNISLELYDILGNKVAIITEGYKTISNHIIQFNTDNISNGLYYIIFRSNGISIGKKFSVIK
ncbi:SBBP repeat-containing protein [Bacteroidota bacterium]